MKKRRQHYVWRYYLEAWAPDDQIYCLRGGDIFKTNPINVANKRDFYRLKELNEKDLFFLSKIIEGCPDLLKRLHQNLISMFSQVFKISRYVNSTGLSNPAFDKAMDIAINNFEEEYHTKIEHSGAKYMNMMLNNNLNFYDSDKDLITFLTFLSVQYMRTEKRQLNVIKATNCQDIIDTKKIWNILRHIFATNIAFDLFNNRKRYAITLLMNENITPFVTSDQPVINTFATLTALKEQVHDVELYYPLSPTVAMLLSKDAKYRKKHYHQLSADMVDEYNRHIVWGSHEQIFSNSEKSLRQIMNYTRSGAD